MRALVLLSLLVAAVPALEDLDYLDPAHATQARHPSATRLYVTFCGTCPSARQRMQTGVKRLAEAIETHRPPLVLICVTPDLQGEGLRSYAESVGIDAERVAFAHDPANRFNVSLRNIWQVRVATPESDGLLRPRLDVDGVRKAIEDPARHAEFGTHRYPKDGLIDDKLLELWWALDRGNPQAQTALARQAKRARADDELGAQVLALDEAVRTTLHARQEEALAAGEGFLAFERLEAAVAASEGYVLEAAEDRLRAWRRERAIRGELRARAAYRKCQTMLAEHSERKRAMGRAGLQQIVDRYPDTVYGGKAAADLADAD